jgi:hypothetical protein
MGHDRGEPIAAIRSVFGIIANAMLCNKLIKKWAMMMDLIHRDPKFSKKRLHTIGASGSNTFYLCVYSGIEQTDSSAWRMQATVAAGGKIGFPIGILCWFFSQTL